MTEKFTAAATLGGMSVLALYAGYTMLTGDVSGGLLCAAGPAIYASNVLSFNPLDDIETLRGPV